MTALLVVYDIRHNLQLLVSGDLICMCVCVCGCVVRSVVEGTATVCSEDRCLRSDCR